MGITDDKICNNALLHTKLARQRSINVRNSMIYLDLLYSYLLLRKQHVKCGPPADRLDCSILTKMASQPCGGIIANTVRVFTARDSLDHPCGCLVDSVLAAVFDRVSTVFVRDNTALEPPWWSLADRQCWKMSTDHPGSLSDTILISAFHDSHSHPCS